MDERFRLIGKKINWVPIVDLTDPRIEDSPHDKRTSAIMFNHLDMLRVFLESGAEFGVFCEDDIYIRRDFDKSILIALDAYKRLGLETLLVGYLLNFPPLNVNLNSDWVAHEPVFTFLNYNDDLWGSQMYIYDRAAAIKALDVFSDPSKVGVFSPDWTLTKLGPRAAIYPMLAVEEGAVNTDDWSQIVFHTECKNAQYDSTLHI